MQAVFYLVSSTEHDVHVWKWGITTKPTAKKRSSAYYDTHRWIEIPSMAVGRAMEQRMGCLMVNVVNDRANRCMYHESISQSFPFEVLLQMFDWVVESFENRERWSEVGQQLYLAACPGIVGLKDAAPEFALEFRKLVEQAQSFEVPARLQPMW